MLLSVRLTPGSPLSFFCDQPGDGIKHPFASSLFFFVSQLGMLPGTLVYVNAGTQLAQIDSVSGIVSAPLLISFALFGLFPILAKK